MKYPLVFLLSLSLLASCSLGTNSSLTTSPDAIGTTSGTTSISPEQFLVTLDTLARPIRSSPDFAQCMDQSVRSCSSTAGLSMAQSARDPSLCDGLLDTGAKDQCRTVVTIDMAKQKKSIAECDTLAVAGRTLCRSEMIRTEAVTSDDLSKCEAIKTERATAPTATASLMGTPTLDPSYEVDQCMIQVISVSSTKTEKECEKITDKGLANMCREIIAQRK